MQAGEQIKEDGQLMQEQADKFDRKSALSSLRKSPIYGNTILEYTTWPQLSDLEEKSDDVLKCLKLNKVEWAEHHDGIASLRVTLNDGAVFAQSEREDFKAD